MIKIQFWYFAKKFTRIFRKNVKFNGRLKSTLPAEVYPTCFYRQMNYQCIVLILLQRRFLYKCMAYYLPFFYFYYLYIFVWNMSSIQRETISSNYHKMGIINFFNRRIFMIKYEFRPRLCGYTIIIYVN